MKKLASALAMLIALTGCLLALASCGGEETSSEAPAESSAAESKEESKAESKEESKDEPADESSEEAPAESSEEPVDESSEEPVEESSEAPTGTTTTDVASVSGTNLALNCKYTGAGAPNIDSQYTGGLTDGVVPEKLTYDPTWFAYWYNAKDAAVESKTNAPEGKDAIVLDLGGVKDIQVIRLLTMVGNVSGITAPAAVQFEYSEDGVKYTEIGTQNLTPQEGSAIAWIGYKLAEPVKAKTVRVTVFVDGTCWTFISELEVY